MIRSHRPALPLRQVIRYYYGVEGHFGSQPVLQPVPARSPAILEFMFGVPFRVQLLDDGMTRDAHPVTLVGPRTQRSVNLFLSGKVDAFTITFQPRGFFTLFGIPLEELTNRDFSAETVLGPSIGELHDRLSEAGSFQQRVHIADAFLSAKYRMANPGEDMSKTATNILAVRGAIRVCDMAGKAGLSIRQFERRFRYEIGITPKLYARIARFEAALALKAMAPDMQWTGIAHSLGYHDQMHMVHDFNQLSGECPTTICGLLDMFVQPEVLSAARPL